MQCLLPHAVHLFQFVIRLLIDIYLYLEWQNLHVVGLCVMSSKKVVQKGVRKVHRETLQFTCILLGKKKFNKIRVGPAFKWPSFNVYFILRWSLPGNQRDSWDITGHVAAIKISGAMVSECKRLNSLVSEDQGMKLYLTLCNMEM